MEVVGNSLYNLHAFSEYFGCYGLQSVICIYTRVVTVWVLWGSILFLILNLHRFSDSLTCQTKLYF